MKTSKTSKAVLKLWNGRWGSGGHVWVAARSRADAARLLKQASGDETTCFNHEIKVYFSNCWGDSMQGVEPDRGVWIVDRAHSKEKPRRII